MIMSYDLFRQLTTDNKTKTAATATTITTREELKKYLLDPGPDLVFVVVVVVVVVVAAALCCCFC